MIVPCYWWVRQITGLENDLAPDIAENQKYAAQERAADKAVREFLSERYIVPLSEDDGVDGVCGGKEHGEAGTQHYKVGQNFGMDRKTVPDEADNGHEKCADDHVVGEIGDVGGEEDNCGHDEGSRYVVQQRGHAGRNDGVEADDIGGNCIGEREQYHQNEKHVPRKERCDFAHVYERLAFYPDYKQNGEQQQRKTAKPQHAEYLVQGGGLRNDAWQQQEEKRTDYADECDFLSQ